MMPEIVGTIELKSVDHREYVKFRSELEVKLIAINARLSQIEDRLAKLEERPKRGRPRKDGDPVRLPGLE